MRDDELMHYGVLGMKWGVHRGHASKAYGKASKKLTKLENKVVKAERKADKAMYKADKRSYGFFADSGRARKARSKARRLQSKANKYKYKTVKWLNNMDKVFANTSVKVSSDQRELGKRYMNSLKENRTANVQRYY